MLLYFHNTFKRKEITSEYNMNVSLPTTSNTYFLFLAAKDQAGNYFIRKNFRLYD